MFSRAIQFLKTDIWRVHSRDFSGARLFFLKVLRVTTLAFKGLREDKCLQKASALTLYSLLSLVPIVAMLLGVARGLGLERLLEHQLMERMRSQEAVAGRIIDFSHAFLESAKGAVFTSVCIIVLFWAIFRVLGTLEKSFNEIWGVRKPRPIRTRLPLYLFFIFFFQTLFIISSTMTVLLTSQLSLFFEKVTFLKTFGPAVFSIMKLSPYLAIWTILSFLYITLPNTKVKLSSGVLAGVLSGTIYQVFQLVYVNSQIGVARYSTFYGSFAALPFFLIWLQLGWLIVFLGAEICFAHQNAEDYEFESDWSKMSYSLRRLFSLRIVHFLVINDHQKKPVDENLISRELKIPIRSVRSILNDLVESDIIKQITLPERKESIFEPIGKIESLKLKDVIDKLEKRDNDHIFISKDESLELILKHIRTFDELIKKSTDNVLIKEIEVKK